ncbi:hypothetical protein I4F81_007229 [Pyropia yezoensis]|uniref:Uncharacterized protein n=1 Tax=Pyropia yezoensis TaxID=2788 RepID=A0ACC3C3J2_PYRYE|nr:hypothetical protein I4F81_007229 [Neopyropia yezoensis]
MGHKNASISSIQDLGNIERWLSEERDVTNIPAGAAELKAHHHISLAAEEEDVRDKLAAEYGRVVAAVPQTALRYARRQTAAERNPWGQGRDAALRMVARAVVAGDPYFRAPVVSDATAYIFPAFFESNVRRVANGVVAIETDEYYKAVESVGLSQDGDFFVLAISATINNKGVTLARFFIQRATRHVARTCYKLFFQEVLKINPRWALWHVLVMRQLSVIDPTLDGAPSAAVLQLATENVRRMSCGVLVGVTMDSSASLAGGPCDALEDVGFDEFSEDELAQSILFGCKAHAHRVSADHAQRAAASTTTNTEESQHERVYKLCERRQPLVVAMTGSKFVDQRDADELDHGRAAGVYTALERAHHSQRRREKRKQDSRPRDGGRLADDEGAAERGDEGDAEAGPPPKRRRRAVWATAASHVAAELRIADLEKQLLEQRSRTLEAENAALRAGAMAEGSGSAVSMAPTVGLPHHPANAAPPAWLVNLMTAASQLPESTPPHGNDVTTALGNGGVEAP